MKYFEYLKEYLPYISDTIKGCTEYEINTVENQLLKKFPLAYKEYLTLVGNDSGEIHEYDRCNLNEIIEMQDEANDIYKRTDHKYLNSDEIVLTTHQNYSFTYLKEIGQNENPPVWIYILGDEIHEYECYKTFTDYIFDCLTRKSWWNKKLWNKFQENGIDIEIPSWMK